MTTPQNTSSIAPDFEAAQQLAEQLRAKRKSLPSCGPRELDEFTHTADELLTEFAKMARSLACSVISTADYIDSLEDERKLLQARVDELVAGLTAADQALVRAEADARAPISKADQALITLAGRVASTKARLAEVLADRAQKIADAAIDGDLLSQDLPSTAEHHQAAADAEAAHEAVKQRRSDLQAILDVARSQHQAERQEKREELRRAHLRLDEFMADRAAGVLLLSMVNLNCESIPRFKIFVNDGRRLPLLNLEPGPFDSSYFDLTDSDVTCLQNQMAFNVAPADWMGRVHASGVLHFSYTPPEPSVSPYVGRSSGNRRPSTGSERGLVTNV